MSILQQINLGAVANDGTGDDLREAFRKTRDNFILIEGSLIPIKVSEYLANISINGGNIAGDSRFTSTTDSTSSTSGALTIDGGLGVQKNVNFGANLYVSGKVVATEAEIAQASVTGGSINGVVIGNTSPTNATFTSVNITSGLNVTGNIVAGQLIVPAIEVNTIQGEIGSIVPNVGTFTDVVTNGNLTVSGEASILSLTAGSINGTIGSDTANPGYFTNVEATLVSGRLTTNSQPDITELGTLTSLVVDGEVTFNGNVFYNLDAEEKVSVFGNLESSGNIIAQVLRGNAIRGGTSESISTTTGAIVVPGGAGIGGNVNVGGEMYVLGNVTLGGTYVPITSSSTGTKGQVAFDSDYMYICVDTDTWKRTALATW